MSDGYEYDLPNFGDDMPEQDREFIDGASEREHQRRSHSEEHRPHRPQEHRPRPPQQGSYAPPPDVRPQTGHPYGPPYPPVQKPVPWQTILIVAGILLGGYLFWKYELKDDREPEKDRPVIEEPVEPLIQPEEDDGPRITFFYKRDRSFAEARSAVFAKSIPLIQQGKFKSLEEWLAWLSPNIQTEREKADAGFINMANKALDEGRWTDEEAAKFAQWVQENSRW